MSETYSIRFVGGDGQPLVWSRPDPPDPVGVEIRFGGTYRARLWLSEDTDDAGRLTVRRVDVIADDDGPAVGTAVVRDMRLGHLLDVAARAVAHTAGAAVQDGARAWAAPLSLTLDATEPDLAGVFDSLGLPALDWSSGSLPTAGEGTADTLRELGPSDAVTTAAVAAIFRYASANGQPPSGFVGAFLGIPQATAARWVAAAREAGALEPSARRRREWSGGRG
ncbi:hypothetical protein [Gordonia jacobaea]|uniref:hypothetical protein n=1 Tax=Gordonia jacobaea TaxID=122202 RepID=UPI0022E8B669|nr:hypothetical protein [Gordonia jacobaea]